MNQETVHVARADLELFCRSIFKALDLSDEDSRIAAEVLTRADVYGIPSHGVGRLLRYVNGLKTGLMDPHAKWEVLMDTPASVVIDARGAMGAPVSVQAMRRVLEKAETNGAAFGCVKNSNHFGIAGYYARLALEKDMLGIAMTNTAALGVPTFGRTALYGTNPLAFAAPADREVAFVLDMSTTVVTRGKVEVKERLGQKLPDGWAVDKNGAPAHDPRTLLDDMQERLGGGILPLGGLGTDLGGHKGYGLAVMVDILCAVLCGAPFGRAVFDTAESSARVSHFFGAIKIENFRDPKTFRADMDDLLEDLRASPPAEGEKRVYFAGMPEMEQERTTERSGVPLVAKTYEMLVDLGREFGIEAPGARV